MNYRRNPSVIEIELFVRRYVFPRDRYGNVFVVP